MKEKKEIKLLKRTEVSYMEFSSYLIMSHLLDNFSTTDGEIYSIIFEAVCKLEKHLHLFGDGAFDEIDDIKYVEEVYGHSEREEEK